MKKYLLILTTLVASFVFSSYAGKNIFVANTPRVNRNYLADLQNKFKKGVNSVYLAFSIFNQRSVKKNVAVVYPNNMVGKAGSPTIVPTTTKDPQQSGFAKIDPATIPTNLFKPFVKGVSAYEQENRMVFKIEEGTSYQVDEIEVDGKKFKVVHLTSQ